MLPDWYQEVAKMLNQSHEALIASWKNIDQYLTDCKARNVEPTPKVIDALRADLKAAHDAVETMKTAVLNHLKQE